MSENQGFAKFAKGNYSTLKGRAGKAERDNVHPNQLGFDSSRKQGYGKYSQDKENLVVLRYTAKRKTAAAGRP